MASQISDFGRGLLAGLLCFAALGQAMAQHAHINAGAVTTEPNAKLLFVNGDLFATNSGYVVNLIRTNSGQYAGYYQGSISFTALPATGNNGGPAFGHAAPGSFLQLEVATLDGPAGGQFGFLEELDITPRFSLAVGESSGTNRFDLSENDATPGSDPFGHIHGRRFSVTDPGLYTVGFRILDRSSNGANSGPIHTPSDVFPLFFQAGLTISSISTVSNSVEIVFAGQPGQNILLEATGSLNDPIVWQTIAGPIPGANRLSSLADTNAAAVARFYRLRAESP